MATGRHHTLSPQARRRARTLTIASFTATAIVAILLAGGAWTMLGGPGGCPRSTVINVAAAPDMASALQELAGRYNSDSDSCGQVQVTEQDSADVLNTVTGHSLTSGGVQPDAWVPESTFWLDLAGTDTAATDATRGTGRARAALPLHPTGISVARSPIVLTAATDVYKKVADDDVTPSWRLLLGDWASAGAKKGTDTAADRLAPMVADPTRNVSGLIAVQAARGEMDSGANMPARLTGFIRGTQQVAGANQQAILSYVGSRPPDGEPIGVTTEQSVWRHNQADPHKKLVAFYPKEGTTSLDYPYAITTSNSAHKRAATAFGDLLNSDYARGLMRQLGFRGADDQAGTILDKAFGINPDKPKVLKRLDRRHLERGLRTWNHLGLNSRMLVIADTSSAIGRMIPGTSTTRLQVATKAARSGLALFPDDSDIGLWTFARKLDGDRDYRKNVPLGPLTQVLDGKTRRTRLRDASRRIKPRTTDGSGLYDTILAAHRKMRRTYRDDRVQSVLILVGSRDDDPGGTSLHRLLSTLHKNHDSRKPVEIISIGFGDAVDTDALDQITKATGGASYTTDDPKQIGKIFLSAISRRVCTPECPG